MTYLHDGINDGVFYLRVPGSTREPTGHFSLPYAPGGVVFTLEFGVLRNNNAIERDITLLGRRIAVDAEVNGNHVGIPVFGDVDREYTYTLYQSTAAGAGNFTLMAQGSSESYAAGEIWTPKGDQGLIKMTFWPEQKGTQKVQSPIQPRPVPGYTYPEQYGNQDLGGLESCVLGDQEPPVFMSAGGSYNPVRGDQPKAKGVVGGNIGETGIGTQTFHHVAPVRREAQPKGILEMRLVVKMPEAYYTSGARPISRVSHIRAPRPL